MKKAILLFCLFQISCSSSSQKAEEVQSDLTAILEKQVEAWNAGSIQGFMAYYWQSDEFTFQSGNNRLHGWQSLFDRYQQNYSGENHGTLNFTDIEVKPLQNDLALVLGRWRVMLPDTTREGLFTLIFKHLPQGWRIVHDHSS